MRIKEGFVKQVIGNKTIVVSAGELSKEFHGMIELNYTAADIWSWVSEGYTAKEIAEKLATKYDIEISRAICDTDKIIQQMLSAGVVEND